MKMKHSFYGMARELKSSAMNKHEEPQKNI